MRTLLRGPIAIEAFSVTGAVNLKTFSSKRDINHFILPSLATESWHSELFRTVVGLGLGRGDQSVGTRVFHTPETGAIRAVPTFELQFVPVRQRLLQFPQEHQQEKDWRDDGPGCLRGIRFALAIEAVGALMVYGLWQLAHLVR